MATVNATQTPQLTTNGQLIIGSTSAVPVAATLTAGAGITVTNGAGSITIAGSTPAPVFAAFRPTLAVDFCAICTMPGMFGDTQSDNLTQTLDFNSSAILMPFYTETAVTTVAMGIAVSVGLAASTATVGLYGSNSDFKPTGAPLAAGSVSTATNGRKEVATVVNLTAYTLYWAAVQLSSAITQSIRVTKFAVYPGNYMGTLGSGGAVPGYYNYIGAYSAGTLPTITTASVNAVGSGYGPIIYFR